jgi:hypothetical protein
MRHITPGNLDRLEDLLESLRELEGLKEKKRGVFYRKSKAFLHFHEDPEGLFADVRLDGIVFERHGVTTQAAQRRLLTRIRAAL